MSRILIVYGTTEGHTRKIAEHMGATLREAGHDAVVTEAQDEGKGVHFAQYDGVVVAGSLHQGRHQRLLTEFVRSNAPILNLMPGAFVSSSLTAVIEDDKHWSEANRCIDEFLIETGWNPMARTPVAGALLYTQYDWLKRMLLRSISKKEGGDTDTTRDYEYTDWNRLDKFVTGFADAVAGRSRGADTGGPLSAPV